MRPLTAFPTPSSRYGRALTRIYDLTLHSRSRATLTFYDDLADLLFQTADEERIQRDHLLPDLSNAEAYPIDYRMEGKSGGQVFLYRVPNWRYGPPPHPLRPERRTRRLR